MNIGILGGGQLSRMLALAGIPLGLDFYFYVPTQSAALHSLGAIIPGDYTHLSQLKKFAEQVDVITFENENIPAATLDYLTSLKPVYPDQRALTITQDRLLEKNFFCDLNIPTNHFMPVNCQDDLLSAAQQLGYPFILKKRTHGYDGKGQVRINQVADIHALSDEQCHNTLAEEWIDFEREVSLIAARNITGNIIFYDVCENLHQNGILHSTHNRINDPIFKMASDYLQSIICALNYVGVLAVEFFQVGKQLLANEMAPRVHNSGHWTIDAAVTSQFENHLRCIIDWPLGNPASLTQAVMYNLLGKIPDKQTLLHDPNLRLHDYEKSPTPHRKVGHFTLLVTNSSSTAL